MKISGISSKKLGDAGEGTLKNSYLYNDKELFDDGDLNWYDYGFRNYDPQIGRFVQLDPLTDDYPNYTPYQFAGNDPIANVDVDGLEPLVVVGAVDNFTLIGQATLGSAELVDAGTESAHWISTLEAATVSFKLPAKVGVSAVKSILTITIRVTVQTTALVDNVAVGGNLRLYSNPPWSKRKRCRWLSMISWILHIH